jgi:hypothetical protein
MRMLMFGAGVLGTFYRAKPSASGNDVTALARGRRAAGEGRRPGGRGAGARHSTRARQRDRSP